MYDIDNINPYILDLFDAQKNSFAERSKILTGYKSEK